MKYTLKINGQPRKIRGQYGKCRLCSADLKDRWAVYFPTFYSVICADKHRDAFVVIEEYDNGYEKIVTPIDVKATASEADNDVRRLNHQAFLLKGAGVRTYTSYTRVPLSELLKRRDNEFEVDSDAGEF